MNYFITGITGTLGSKVTEKLLSEGHHVTGISRDECKQASFPKHGNLTLYLGDIRDRARVVEATRNADLIFHFAALKHVDQLEANPEEAIETNIIGTKNVLHAQRVHGIPRVVLSSTDKAVYPVNAYGMSKGIAERLVLRNPNNVVCRYGNVLASRGSVIERLVKTLQTEQAVNLTDPNMSRFWITQDEARDFILGMSKVPQGGLKIPPMRAAPLHLIANAVADILQIKGYMSRQVGSRPGEKLSECIRTEYEGEELHSHSAPQYTEQELSQVLAPIVKALA